MLLDVVDLHEGDEDTCKYKYNAKEEVVSCLDTEVTIEQAHGVTEQEVLRPGKKRRFYASVEEPISRQGDVNLVTGPGDAAKT